MTQVEELYMVLRANTSGFSASLKGAAAEGEAFTSKITRGTKQLAAFGVLGTAALVGVGVKSLDMSVKFQAATERIRTQAGASQAEVAKVRDAIYAMAGKTAQGPERLAESFYHVESAGYRGRVAVDLVRQAYNLADVSGANLEDTTNGIIGVLQSGWVRGAHAAAQATATLNAIVGAGNMKMQDLNGALSTGIAAASSTFGVSMQSTGAALALMTDMGVPAQQAATHLRMTLSLLAAPSKAAAKYLHDIGLRSADAGVRISATQQILQKAGVTTTQISNDLRKPDGLMVALTDLKQHMTATGLTANEQGALISRAFGGGKSGAAIMEMYGRLDLLKQKYVQIGKGVDDFSADVAATHQTLAWQLGSFKNKIETAAIRIGDVLRPIATKVLRDINLALDWLGKHKQVAIALGAALGGVLAVGLATAAVAAWALVSPFLAVAAPIAAVAGGLVYLYEKSKTFRDIVQGTGRVLKDALGASMQWISHTALPALKNAWNTVWHAIGGVINWFITGPVAWIRTQLHMFAAFWKAHGDSIMTLTKKIWDFVSTAIMTNLRLIWDLIRPVLSLIASSFKTAWDLVWNTIKIVWRLITNTVHAGIQGVLDVVGLFADLLTGKWGRIWGDVKKLVGDALSNVGKLLGDFASGALHLLWQAGKDLIQGLINGVKSMAGSAGDAIKNVGKGLVHSVTSLLGIHSPSRVFHEIGKNIVDGLVNGMHAHMSKAERHAAALAHRVIAAHRKTIAAELRGEGTALTRESHHISALGKMIRTSHDSKSIARTFAKDFAEALRNEHAAHALLGRVMHDRLSTVAERHHAAAEARRSDHLVQRIQHLHHTAVRHQAHRAHHHNPATHPAHHAAGGVFRHGRHLGARAAELRDLPSYLALTRARSLTGIGGLSTVSLAHPAEAADSGMAVPVVNVTVLVDSSEVAAKTHVEHQTRNLRHERRNVSNGNTRYGRR